MSDTEIYTIGHSTHPADVFLSLLTRHGISRLADIRTVPKSRRHPQFNIQNLDPFLAESAIQYRHFAALGGLRKPRPDSINTAWQHPGFRGYADYMQTPDFATGVGALLEFAAGGVTAVMCAEAVWWRCHRRLLADALVVRGVTVWHILPSGPPKPHHLSEFARVDGLGLTYPGLV